LMYGEDIRDVVEDTFEKRKMETVKNAVQRNAIQQLSKPDAVVLVRHLGKYWRMITFTTLLYDLVPYAITVNKPKFDYLIASFMAFLERLRVLNVENAYDVQRLVPGNELAQLLGGLQPRLISEAQENAIVYQIVHDITTRAEMEAAITSGQFTFPSPCTTI